ncbi:MAG: EF-P lysine aminoacylase GenX [Alkalispirochaetaceae bacterium]
MDLANLERRNRVTQAIRAVLREAGYLEVETPRLAETPIPESHIELFRTRLRPRRGVERDLFLLPSPEYWLKQLLAAGSGNIFEIARAFRNVEESGPYHRHEFTMLEYYTVDADAADSIAITEDILRSVAGRVEPADLDPGVADALRSPEPFTRMTMAEAFSRYAGIDLEANLTREAIARSAATMEMRVSPQESWEDLFNRIFLNEVEPELPTETPLFITHYPAAIPTLARQIPATPWADRWELYFRGQEIANCYGEERDPERIAEFLAREAARKEAESLEPHPVDPRYLQGPGGRLPRCSGVALGVDRLIMVLGGLPSLDGVIYFSISDTMSK